MCNVIVPHISRYENTSALLWWRSVFSWSFWQLGISFPNITRLIETSVKKSPERQRFPLSLRIQYCLLCSCSVCHHVYVILYIKATSCLRTVGVGSTAIGFERSTTLLLSCHFMIAMFFASLIEKICVCFVLTHCTNVAVT